MNRLCFKTSPRIVLTPQKNKKAFLTYAQSPDCDNHAAVLERNIFLAGIPQNSLETLQLLKIQ